VLNGVLDGKLAALAAARVVNVGPGVCQLTYRLVRVRVVDRTEVRQVQRRAAVLTMWLVCMFTSKQVGVLHAAHVHHHHKIHKHCK